MCFRDMTFCSDAEQCSNSLGCHRHYDIHQETAAKAWAKGLPCVPVMFGSFKDTCLLYREKSC